MVVKQGDTFVQFTEQDLLFCKQFRILEARLEWLRECFSRDDGHLVFIAGKLKHPFAFLAVQTEARKFVDDTLQELYEEGELPEDWRRLVAELYRGVVD